MNETNGTQMHLEYPVQGGNFSGAGGASSSIKNVLKQLGIQYDTIKRVAIASYESEMNIVAYATKGKLLVDIEPGEIINYRRGYRPRDTGYRKGPPGRLLDSHSPHTRDGIRRRIGTLEHEKGRG